MPFSDLREFIAKAEELGAALRIKEEVDWNLEAGAMVRRSDEGGLPALLFERVKDYPGHQLFGEVLGTVGRIAITMDMPPDTPVRRLQDEYLRRKLQPIKPVLVKDGPCKENVHVGSEVDLFEFPSPLLHQGDGGRYIGTSHLTISRDLESDWVNWGMYRHMLHDKNTVGLQSGFVSHLMMMRRVWTARKKDLEVAIAIGTEPVSTLLAASPVPYGISEADVVGGIRGKPVELVKCETVDLAVPATSEIVIEGLMSWNETRDEGPFGEYTGYIGGHREPRPIIHVTAVTHRNNPILTVGCEGMPVTTSHTILGVIRAAEFRDLAIRQGLPVTDVYLPLEAANTLAVVAAKPPFMADEIASAIWGARGGRYTPYIIIVEDDVDPFDMNQVIHALVTRCHPYRGIFKHEIAAGTALLPYLNRHEQKYLIGAKAYFDCSWPRDWSASEIPKRAQFSIAYPPDIQRKVLDKLAKYGL